jgi:hypothetical protein
MYKNPTFQSPTEQVVSPTSFGLAANSYKLNVEAGKIISADHIGQTIMGREAASFYDPYQATLNTLQPDSAGMYRPEGQEMQALTEVLASYDGMSAQLPNEQTIASGIERAKQIVESGQAKTLLGELPFIDDKKAGKLSNASKSDTFYLRDGTLNLSPDYIVGASGFKDWNGRPTILDDNILNRKTILSSDKIADFATRDTKLPPTDVMAIFLTDKGMFAYSGNAHRAAAAKLRQEDLQLKSFFVRDLRGRVMSGSPEANTIDAALRVVETNLALRAKQGKA